MQRAREEAQKNHLRYGLLWAVEVLDGVTRLGEQRPMPGERLGQRCYFGAMRHARMHRRGTHGIVAAMALWLGGGSALVRAQANPAAVRQKQPAQSMRRIDVQKLTFPPRVWSYPLGSADPVLFGDHILVLEPSGRVLSSLSAQQGRARFALAAPPGVTWREVEHRPRDLVLLSGTDEKGQPTLSRISVDGKLLWHSVVNRYEHLMSADLGSGLWLTDRNGCQQSLLDGDTGKPPAPELVWRGNYDYGAFADPLQPSPPRFCVLTGHLRLWHRGMALLWTGSKNPGGGVLVAEAPGETPQRRWSIDGAEFRILRIDGNDITFSRAFPQSGLLRVRLSSGAIIWQRELADACDPYEDRFVQLVRRDGIPSAALIQSCRQAQLVELPSGQVRWTRPTAGAMALLREIDPLDIGPPFPWQAVVLPNRNSKGQRSIRLFSSDGRSTEGPPLPADLTGVVPVPGGLILTRADGVQMVQHGGQAVWELAGVRYNSLRSGDYFLVQRGDPKTGPQVVIEIASGRAFLISHGPIRPLAQPVAARGLWLSVLDNPRTLVAWALTAAATEKTSVVEGRAP